METHHSTRTERPGTSIPVRNTFELLEKVGLQGVGGWGVHGGRLPLFIDPHEGSVEFVWTAFWRSSLLDRYLEI